MRPVVAAVAVFLALSSSTPAHAQSDTLLDHPADASFYVGDTISLNRLTANLALRYDDSRSSALEIRQAASAIPARLRACSTSTC